MEFTTEAKPSAIGLNNDATQRSSEIKQMFWFEKSNGEVFCCDEKQAWEIVAGRIKILGEEGIRPLRHKFKGASDGSLYWEGMKNLNEIFKTNGQEAAQSYLRDLEKQEYARADESKRPRNFDRVDLSGNPSKV